MANEQFPELEKTAELLEELRKINQSTSQISVLASQLSDLEKQFTDVSQKVNERIDTVGEGQIRTFLTELETLHVAVEQEAATFRTADAERAESLKASAAAIRGSKHELLEQKKSRLFEHLEPVRSLVEQDHDAVLAKRVSDAAPVLDEFVTVTEAGVRGREAKLRKLVQTSQEQVKSHIAQRDAARAKLVDVTAKVKKSESTTEPTLFAIPFFVVETEQEDGSVEVEVVPPSAVVEDGDHPFEIGLEPAAWFGPIKAGLERQREKLLKLSQESDTEREVRCSGMLSPKRNASLVERAARSSMVQALIERKVSLRHADTLPGTAELAGRYLDKVTRKSTTAQ